MDGVCVSTNLLRFELWIVAYILVEENGEWKQVVSTPFRREGQENKLPIQTFNIKNNWTSIS